MTTTLDELKKRWFIDVSDATTSFPPSKRYPESKQLQPFTDGNLVIPLIDGKDYMGKVRDSITKLPAQSDIWFVGWEFDNVATLGATATLPQNRAWDLIADAHSRQITVCGLVSQHVVPSYPLNAASISYMRFIKGINSILFDLRYPPPLGSHHQKFFCIRDAQNNANSHVLLGSLDLTRARWDHSTHLPTDDNRENPIPGQTAKSTHDLGVYIKGPAMADIEATFLERWNDPSIITFDHITKMPIFVPFKITKPLTVQPPQGSQSVQVLRTYGCFSRPYPLGYSWLGTGEFTIWASYLNAIMKAKHYIYIEDQYFMPFGAPPYFDSSESKVRDSDLFYQIRKRLEEKEVEKKVKILVVVPHKSEDPFFAKYQNYHRNNGIKYLTNAAGAKESLIIATLFIKEKDPKLGESPIFVHSKIMIVDDEFVLVGTPNFNQRSMTADSEIALGIVDEQNAFAKNLRMKLWAEHLDVPLADVEDPAVGYDLFKEAVASPTGIGRVRAYDATLPPKPPIGHDYTMRSVLDPYRGPKR